MPAQAWVTLIVGVLSVVGVALVLNVVTSIAPVRVSGDPVALARLLRNVVDNAIRHAEASISLTTGPCDDVARIVVDDDGPGIAPDDRERVFGRFVRLDSSRTRNHGGTGLGLAIVTDIAAAHSGSVSITAGPSGGARVVIDLPRQR